MGKTTGIIAIIIGFCLSAFLWWKGFDLILLGTELGLFCIALIFVGLLLIIWGILKIME